MACPYGAKRALSKKYFLVCSWFCIAADGSTKLWVCIKGVSLDFNSVKGLLNLPG
jgi:hypothetical protein